MVVSKPSSIDSTPDHALDHRPDPIPDPTGQVRSASVSAVLPISPPIDAHQSPIAPVKIEGGALSPAQFEALMPDPKLKEILSPEDYAALMPDWKRLESDEPEMESSCHYMQLLLLVSCLEYLWRDRDDFFIGANLTIYYSPEQVKTRDYRGPDFFLVKNTQHKPRRSWVIWEENHQFPNVIIELLFIGTASVDRNLKKMLYAETFKTPEYFWFDPEHLEFQGFRLDPGSLDPGSLDPGSLENGHYVAIEPNAQGHLWSEELGLFLGIESEKLRYFYPTGAIVRTSEEDAIQLAADVEEQTARADRLAAQLRSLGLDPDHL